MRTTDQILLASHEDIFQGQWCPYPRDCFDLVECIRDEIKEVEDAGDRVAFLEYLKEAPAVEFDQTKDPTKCGELREYFEYDKEYPDDGRICSEVRELQVSKMIATCPGLSMFRTNQTVMIMHSALLTLQTWMDLLRERLGPVVNLQSLLSVKFWY